MMGRMRGTRIQMGLSGAVVSNAVYPAPALGRRKFLSWSHSGSSASLLPMRILCPALLLFALASCGGEGGGAAPHKPPLVGATPVVTMRFVDRIEAVGTARAREQVTLSAPVTERIVRINFEDGGYVHAGQVIAELAQGQEAAQLAEARGRAREADQQLRRLQSLKASGFATNASVDTQLALQSTARAQAAEARASIGDRRS